MTADNTPKMVYTDAYGVVTERQCRTYLDANVTPAESDTLYDLFGRDAEKAMDFVVNNTHDGTYLEPWPMPGKEPQK